MFKSKLTKIELKLLYSLIKTYGNEIPVSAIKNDIDIYIISNLYDKNFVTIDKNISKIILTEKTKQIFNLANSYKVEFYRNNKKITGSDEHDNCKIFGCITLGLDSEIKADIVRIQDNKIGVQFKLKNSKNYDKRIKTNTTFKDYFKQILITK